MTDAIVYHEFAEVVVKNKPPARVYQEFVEVVIKNKPPARVYHEFIEAVVLKSRKNWWSAD